MTPQRRRRRNPLLARSRPQNLRPARQQRNPQLHSHNRTSVVAGLPARPVEVPACLKIGFLIILLGDGMRTLQRLSLLAAITIAPAVAQTGWQTIGDVSSFEKRPDGVEIQ